jgi:hypothetical protein
VKIIAVIQRMMLGLIFLASGINHFVHPRSCIVVRNSDRKGIHDGHASDSIWTCALRA